MDAEITSWVGIVSIAIAAVVTISQGVIAAMRNKTDKQYDVDLALLKDENKELRGLLVECKEQHDASEKDRADLWRKLVAAEHKADVAAEAARKADARITELEAQIDFLKSVAGK
jgi:chromosome segregation ATPase